MLLEAFLASMRITRESGCKNRMKHEKKTRKRLMKLRDAAERELKENVLPFWTNHAWDSDYGGFLTRLNRTGKRLASEEKFLMMQARMLASLSMAHAFGLSAYGYLEMADRAFDFLTAYMWDADEKGFWFSVARDGTPRSRRKNTDAHAYALLGLAAYYNVSGRPEAREFADEVFALLQERARDGKPGYTEDFDDRQWEPLVAEEMHLPAQDEIKSIDTHTNIMEAFAYLYAATGDRRHQEALESVLDLILSKGIDPVHGCTVAAFTSDWVPISDAAGRMTTSFGLNVELAWLLLMANGNLAEPTQAAPEAAIGLVNHALTFGFDRQRGGLAAFSTFDQRPEEIAELPPDSRWRLWWTQAELMNALVDLAQLTGNREYLVALTTQWEWIWSYQIDHEGGDWYEKIDPATATPLSTEKGGEWKTSFHTGRALMRTITGIEKLLEMKETHPVLGMHR